MNMTVPKLLYYKTMTTGSLPETIKVYLTDEHHHDLDYNRMRLYFIDAAIWATKHCPSYKRFDIQDVADHSIVCDQIAEYEFTDERDVIWFKLRWL
jgi:6-phosphogluconolactonase/glucosamine-6-phosphate isomerase/deaminase